MIPYISLIYECFHAVLLQHVWSVFRIAFLSELHNPEILSALLKKTGLHVQISYIVSHKCHQILPVELLEGFSFTLYRNYRKKYDKQGFFKNYFLAFKLYLGLQTL